MKLTKTQLRKLVKEESLKEGKITLKKGSSDIQTRGNLNKLKGATIESIYGDESNLKIKFDNKKTLHFEVNASADEPYAGVWISSWLMVE